MFDTVICASSRRLDASLGASERHDLAVRISIIRPARYCSPDAAASTASRSAFVTCARPSVGRDGEGYRSDLGLLASKISEFQKLVARPSRRLRLRPGRVLINPERSQTWRCPRYPRKRTSGLAFGPSALCHLRTHALQQTAVIFDQFARRREPSDNANRTSQSNAIVSTKSEFSFPKSNLVVRDDFTLTLCGVLHLSFGVQSAV